MDCDDFTFALAETLRGQMRELSGDEFIVLDAIRIHKVILDSQGFVGSSTLLEMYCKGWLMRAEFSDNDWAYKAKPDVMLEFEQYLRETK